MTGIVPREPVLPEDAAPAGTAPAARPATTRPTSLAWAGLVLAIIYWVVESAIHTFVFGTGTLSSTLLGEHDPNELWMRLLISVLFVGFGSVAEGVLRAERRLKENALRLNRLLRFAGDVSRRVRPSDKRAAGASVIEVSPVGLASDDFVALAGALRDLSAELDARFRDLYVLLELTHQINMGMLLDEVLEKAYPALRTVIPFDRMGVALLEDDGRKLRARWARSDGPIRLVKGYAGAMPGSSLQRILESGEPRIINDLERHLLDHPGSESTRLIVAEGIRSSLTCPLVSLGRPIGFCFFSSRGRGVYRDAHVELFQLIAGHVSVVVEKSRLYEEILAEKAKSEKLLLNVMPARIAARLRAGDTSIAEHLATANVLFADIVDFTSASGALPPQRVVAVLQEVFGRFDRMCDPHRIEKIKTIGDCYMAITAPSEEGDDGPLRDLAAFALEALSVSDDVRWPDGRPVTIRIGMHAGPAVAGVIGQRKFSYDVWGDTVNVASRMVSTGDPGRIHVTDEVHARLAERFEFVPRGEIQVRGKGPMSTWFLTGRNVAARGPTPGTSQRSTS